MKNKYIFLLITKEKVKHEIDKLSDVEVEKVYLYLSSLKKKKETKPRIRSLKLNGKLDIEQIQNIAYE